MDDLKNKGFTVLKGFLTEFKEQLKLIRKAAKKIFDKEVDGVRAVEIRDINHNKSSGQRMVWVTSNQCLRH